METTIHSLITQLKNLYKIDLVIFTTPEYVKFKDELTEFIFVNQLQDTEEWNTIINNLVFTSRQYMTTNEADTILIQLEKIKHILLNRKYENFCKYIPLQ